MKSLSSSSRWHYCHCLDYYAGFILHSQNPTTVSWTAELLWTLILAFILNLCQGIHKCIFLYSVSQMFFFPHFWKLFTRVNASWTLCVSFLSSHANVNRQREERLLSSPNCTEFVVILNCLRDSYQRESWLKVNMHQCVCSLLVGYSHDDPDPQTGQLHTTAGDTGWYHLQLSKFFNTYLIFLPACIHILYFHCCRRPRWIFTEKSSFLTVFQIKYEACLMLQINQCNIAVLDAIFLKVVPMKSAFVFSVMYE